MKTINHHTGVLFLLLILLTSSLTFSSGVEIKCTFKDFGWYIVGSVYSCFSGEFIVLNNSTIIESVTGNHASGKSNSDVKGLSVWNEKTLQRIPINIESFFPNLEVLQWDNGNLVSITADDLRPFSELKMLILYDNKIVQLDSELFQYTPKLSWLSFWTNQITNVGLDLLTDLNELTYADFDTNPCINFFAGSRQAIQELKQKLVKQCPPLASTTPIITTTTTMRTTSEDVCDVRCTINDEVDELKKENAEQSELIAKSKERINFLEDLAERSEELAGKNEERFQELEKQIREILGQP